MVALAVYEGMALLTLTEPMVLGLLRKQPSLHVPLHRWRSLFMQCAILCWAEGHAPRSLKLSGEWTPGQLQIQALCRQLWRYDYLQIQARGSTSPEMAKKLCCWFSSAKMVRCI